MVIEWGIENRHHCSVTGFGPTTVNMAQTRSKPARDIPKAYDPGAVEQRLYGSWIDGGYFTPTIDPEKEPFVIIMPPPNVTGELHLGHALQATLADIMVRWHRMKGEPTLWLPGADHAGIATQVMVERSLAQEAAEHPRG